MKIPRLVNLMLTVLILIASCSKEQNEQTDAYLVDYKFEFVYPLETIGSMLSVLLYEYPEASGLLEHAEYGVQLYTIEYYTHYEDSLIIASGLVCMPMADKGFPVISFQNGTNTAHDNAPSKDLFNENYLMLQLMASNGYIILIPDYIGFGASESILHPYYHRTSTNNAVIDMMQAFEELENKNDILPYSNNNTYLMGYSQGGWATLSAFDEIENGEETGINIAAVSCGAGAYDLMTMSAYVLGQETFPGPLYLPYFIYSQMDMGLIQDPLEKFFKSPYAEKIPQLFDGSLTNSEVVAELTDQIADLVTDNMRNNFQTGQDFVRLREVLTENSITAWNTSKKLHFYHGTDDLNVPPEQSLNMYNDFIDAGADPNQVSLFELNGSDHSTGLVPWGILTLNWFNALEDK